MRPACGSVGRSFIFAMSGLERYMFRRLIVALVLNIEPTFPPEGSGLFGLEDAFDFLIALPFFPDFFACTTFEIF